MDLLQMTLMILGMAGITYVIRMIPLVFFRKKIHSKYILSVLYYIPYAVLSAMTFPYILYSTGNTPQSFYTALIGTVVAIIASVSKKSLLTVAILSCLAVLIASFLIV